MGCRGGGLQHPLKTWGHQSQGQRDPLCGQAGHWAENGDLTDGLPCLLLSNPYTTLPTPTPSAPGWRSPRRAGGRAAGGDASLLRPSCHPGDYQLLTEPRGPEPDGGRPTGSLASSGLCRLPPRCPRPAGGGTPTGGRRVPGAVARQRRPAGSSLSVYVQCSAAPTFTERQEAAWQGRQGRP